MVLWVYIVLLVVGGLIGFLKAGSKISLIASVVSAVPLVLCALKIIPGFPIAPVILGCLAAMFIVRFKKGKKFMPSGMMAVLTILFEAAVLCFHFGL